MAELRGHTLRPLSATSCRGRKSSPPRVAFAPLSPRDAEALLASLGSQDGGASDAAPSSGAAPSIRRWGSVKGLFRLGQDAAQGSPRPGGPAGGRASHKALNGAGGRAGGELHAEARLELSEQGMFARALAASRGSARSEAAQRGRLCGGGCCPHCRCRAGTDCSECCVGAEAACFGSCAGCPLARRACEHATVRAKSLSVPQKKPCKRACTELPASKRGSLHLGLRSPSRVQR